MSFVFLAAERILVDAQGRILRAEARLAGSTDPHGGPLQLEGRHDGVGVLEWDSETTPPPGARLLGLRPGLGLLDPEEAHLAGRARQLLEWRRTHRFCGECGGRTELGPRGSSLRCTECDRDHFPRVTPAVIVLVHDGDRALLGRHGRLPDGMYSTLAGFVEPGESAEDTVHREIEEEAGIAVADLRYRASQPWPFPHSLMLGYLARYAGGTLRRDEDELDDLAWFHRDRLPRIPPPETIARTLIEAWLAGEHR